MGKILIRSAEMSKFYSEQVLGKANKLIDKKSDQRNFKAKSKGIKNEKAGLKFIFVSRKELIYKELEDG